MDSACHSPLQLTIHRQFGQLALKAWHITTAVSFCKAQQIRVVGGGGGRVVCERNPQDDKNKDTEACLLEL